LEDKAEIADRFAMRVIARLRPIDRPPRDPAETGDHSQQGRFSAARWAKDADELPVTDGQIDVG
jgi:hypothetical protein